jgi:hypothetical protein
LSKFDEKLSFARIQPGQLLHGLEHAIDRRNRRRQILDGITGLAGNPLDHAEGQGTNLLPFPFLQPGK